MPTDDTRTAIGDYTNQRRKTNISLYHIDFPLGDVILLSYVFNFHWRLLIIEVKNKCTTLLDPFQEATDCPRVFDEFKNFLKACKDNTSFGKLKKIEWSIKVYEKHRRYQNVNDCSNCGIYVMYYMDCIGMNTSMDTSFDPKVWRRTICETLLINAEDISQTCLYCLSKCEEKNAAVVCNVCSRKVHEACIPYGEVDTDEESKATLNHDSRVLSTQKQRSNCIDFFQLNFKFFQYFEFFTNA